MLVRFLCPFGHRLQVSAAFAGERGQCPECLAWVVIPVRNPQPSGRRKKGWHDGDRSFDPESFAAAALNTGNVDDDEDEDDDTDEQRIPQEAFVEVGSVFPSSSWGTDLSMPSPEDDEPEEPPRTSEPKARSSSHLPPIDWSRPIPPLPEVSPRPGQAPRHGQAPRPEQARAEPRRPEPPQDATPAQPVARSSSFPPVSQEVAPLMPPGPTSPTSSVPGFAPLPPGAFGPAEEENIGPPPGMAQPAYLPPPSESPGGHEYAPPPSPFENDDWTDSPEPLASYDAQQEVLPPIPVVVRERQADTRSLAEQAGRKRMIRVYLLGLGLLIVTLAGLAPAAMHLDPLTAPGWARVVWIVAILQIGYIFWMIILPDWSTVWLGSILFGVSAAFHALAWMVIALSAGDVPLPFQLEQLDRSQAGLWCGIQILALGLMSLICARFSGLWRRSWELERRQQRLAGATGTP
jgi:hypothetical protein